MIVKSSRLEPKNRRYVKGYGFLSFAKPFTTDAGKDFGKIAGKKILTKSAEATGDLVGSKIANKITNVGKSKNKSKNKNKTNDINEVDDETSKTKEIYIPPEKRQQIINEMRLL